MNTCAPFVIGMALFSFRSAQAQRPEVQPAIAPTTFGAVRPYSLAAAVGSALRSVPDSGTAQRTYWLEGGTVAGVLAGVAGAGLVVGLSEREKCAGNTALGFGFGAAVGFPVGALIGGQIPKHGQ